MLRERELQDAIVEAARWRGWTVYHTFDSRRSAQGFPDLVLVRRARIIFAELKVGTNRLSLDQVTWRNELAGVQSVAEHLAEVAGSDRRPIVSVFEWREADWLEGRVEIELVAE